MVEMLGPYELGPGGENQGIYTGDARELAKEIPDGSVDLIFTDPPYPKKYIWCFEWVAQMGAKKLKPGGDCMALSGQYHFPAVFDGMRKHLDYHWLNCLYMPNPAQIATFWPRRISIRWKPLLWFTRGPSAHKFVSDGMSNRVMDKRFHRWGQGIAWAWYWIQELTDYNSIILDPMVGGGTVPAVCKMLGRKYFAFEIDPQIAEEARERVRNTNPPLFTIPPQQPKLIA
jgi:DNA modification methylase